LKDIKGLGYSSEAHFSMLATELVTKCMNDPLACKGMEASNADQKTPSELYMEVAREMCQYFTGKDGEIIKFNITLSKTCQQYFNEFTNKDTSMDNNNPRRVSNYKGFMNMVGLMYTYGLFPQKIITVCFQKIIALILRSALTQEETDNYYFGFERLMNRILTHFEKALITPTLVSEFARFKPYLESFNNDIQLACGGPNADKNDRSVKRPIRTYSIILLEQNINRLTKLCERLDQSLKSERN
jgi:hypothetical protein